MDDLIKCLYQFTAERRMTALENDQEYKDSVCSVLRWEEVLRAQLAQDQHAALDQLLMELSNRKALECEYLFQAALGLARELDQLIGQSQIAVAK